MSWKTLRENKTKIFILILAFIIVLNWDAIKLQIYQLTSYTSAYEGAKARFYGVYDTQTDQKYTAMQYHDASLHQFDTTMKWDRDDYFTGAPNIMGEMTTVYIPSKSVSPPQDWVPSEWWRDTLQWENPVNVYTWHVKVGDTTHVYRMEEWKTKWYVTFSAEWDSGPSISMNEETDNQRYRNVEVWIEFDIQPVWYFEDQDAVYFAIAKVELSNVKVAGSDMAGNELPPNPSLSFTPESVGSALTIYTEPFGTTQAETEEELKSFYYHNVTLNPLYFRDKVYIHIDLNDFGTQEWQEWLSWKARGDVVTLGFTVTQFVVGEWQVKDVSDIEEYEGRTAKTGQTGWTPPDFLKGIADWFANISPWTWAGLGTFGLLAIFVIVFALLIYINPSFLFKLLDLLRGRKG